MKKKNKLHAISDDDKKMNFQKDSSADAITMKQMAQQLLEKNKQLIASDSTKTKFLSLIKNEFNNPMSSLLNLSKRLTNETNSNNIKSISHMIYAELLRMEFQFQNIFTITELESGLINKSISKIDIDELLKDIKAQFFYLLKERSLTLNFQIQENFILITDANKLYLILLNFILNAAQFSDKKTTITIKFYYKDNYIYIDTIDQGSGIPLKIQEKYDIFEPFQSFNKEKAYVYCGLGIGLSVAKNLAEIIDGTISYESNSISTRFSLKLPKIESTNNIKSFGSNEIFFDESLNEDENDTEF